MNYDISNRKTIINAFKKFGNSTFCNAEVLIRKNYHISVLQKGKLNSREICYFKYKIKESFIKIQSDNKFKDKGRKWGLLIYSSYSRTKQKLTDFKRTLA